VALIRAGGAVLAHLEEIAHEKADDVATFMPLIKKRCSSSHWCWAPGHCAEPGLAGDGPARRRRHRWTGLCPGRQDTIANLFGSFVVVVDHPFRVGDVVKIGTAEAGSRTLACVRPKSGRRPARFVIPNKTVASEAITNFTRMPQRRVDQTIGLTYDATPDQMQTIARTSASFCAATRACRPTRSWCTLPNMETARSTFTSCISRSIPTGAGTWICANAST